MTPRTLTAEQPHFDEFLEESVKVHGHLCPGQVLGVRMALLGLEAAGIADPKGADRKNIMVIVEIDRCATDAIQSVTGCSLGRRTMKFLDYGKMAATFINLQTGKAVRVVAREDAREKARASFPEIEDKYAAQLRAYRLMSDDDLFETAETKVALRPEDMPGRPLGRVRCERCGEYVQDLREVHRDGRTLCTPCADGLAEGRSFFLPPVMQKSHNDLRVKSKVWIEVGGEPVFGKGRMQLLEGIGRYGSITQAARMVNISYRKAWGYISAMEERLGIRLVERTTGGKSGGGAVITEEAREFLRQYERLEKDIRELADARFAEHLKAEHPRAAMMSVSKIPKE